MAGIVCDEGVSDLWANGWSGIHGASNLALRLFTSPGSLTPSDPLANYLPPSGGGYADHVYSSTDTFAGGTVAGGLQVYTGPPTVFAIPTSGPNILGGVYYDNGSGKALAAVLLSAPVDPALQGGSLTVTPSLQVGPAP